MFKSLLLSILPVTFFSIVAYAQFNPISTQLDPGITKILNQSWALKNQGENQFIDLSLVQTYRLQARSGEDLQVPTPLTSYPLGRKVRVAVLDTGVDINHPGLFNRIAKNPKECARLALYKSCLSENKMSPEGCGAAFLDTKIAENDSDKNSYPMDCSGWNVLSAETPNRVFGTPIIEDEVGHGTHVASLVASVSSQIEIVPVQVLGSQFKPNQPIKPFSLDLSPNEDLRNGYDAMGGGQLAQIVARGIIYAITAKVDIISLSIGWPQLQDHEILRDAIKSAQDNGIIVVAAAGNDSTSALLRPCQYDNVICVAASRPDGGLASFSNFGYGVDVAAPGVSIPGLVPNQFRSIRLPGYFGVDIMSGTSQATPLVSGLIAEMLARGIPKGEIYPRLILGSRSIKKELPVLVGPFNTPGVPAFSNLGYEKTILGGLVDGKQALAIQPQPLILNNSKETVQIVWNRKQASFPISFALKNFWKSANAKVTVSLDLVNVASVLPQLSQVKLNGGSDGSWLGNEVKLVTAKLDIVDVKIPSESRIPRELNFEASIFLNGKLHRKVPLRAEIIVKLDSQLVSDEIEIQSLKLSRQKDRGEKFFLIDEIFDKDLDKRDYFMLNKSEKDFTLAIAKMVGAEYQMTKPTKFKIDGKLGPTRPLHRMRVDVDGDGISEYVLTLQEFFSTGDLVGASSRYTMHLFVLNQDMTLKKYLKFKDKRVLFPTEFTWMRLGKELRPAWIAQGFAIKSPVDVDLWGDDDNFDPDSLIKQEDESIYFYYLGQNWEISQVAAPKDHRIVDLKQPRREAMIAGLVPVLVAKNLGTPIKPSYLNYFYVANVQNGQLSALVKIDDIDPSVNYRNLIDTRKDKTLNLGLDINEYSGNFWFGMDAHQKQRVSIIESDSVRVTDRFLESNQQIFDAPLRVRASYSGAAKNANGSVEQKQSTFVMTNTEIEFHDLSSNEKAQTSLNKYTFIGDDLIVDLQFPITLTGAGKKSLKRPALFTSEGSGLSSSVRILTADYGANGKLKGLVSPARLSFQSPEGCRPLDYPFFINQEYALDFDCGDKFIRVRLRY